MKKIELHTLENGIVLDLFDSELKKVLANIDDENTTPDSKRSIIIKISIKPDEVRRFGELEIAVSSKLSHNKVNSMLTFGRDKDGKLHACEDSGLIDDRDFIQSVKEK